MFDRRDRITKSDLWLLAILVPALVLRLVYLSQYHGSPAWEQLTVDNWYHHHWAQSLADGNILGDTTYFRAPFYVYCLGLLYAAFGASLWVGRLFGLCVGLGSIAMTYVIGKKVLGRTGGLIASALHALLPIVMYFESELLLDPLFTLLLQVAIWRFLVWLERERRSDLFWAGLAFGLAAIGRPTGLLIAALALAWIVFTRPTQRRSRGSGHTLVRAAVFMAGITVCVGPIFVRNLVVAGDPVLIASQGGINLYIGNNESADGLSAVLPEPLGFNWRIRQITHVAESDLGRALKPGEVSAYWQERATDWMSAHPADFISLLGKKLVYLVADREVPNERSLDAHFASFPLLGRNPLSFGLVFPLAVLGMAVWWKRVPAVRFVAASIVIFLFGVALFFVSSRFRLPLLPLYCVMAAGGIVWLQQSFRKPSWRTAGALVMVVALGWSCFLPPVSYVESWSVQSLNSQGLFLYSKGEWREAADVFRRAAALQPDFPEINLNLGAAYMRLGHTDSARTCFDREVRINPLRYKAYQNLASISLLEGNYAEAVRQAEIALASAPYDVMSHLVRMRALGLDPDVDNARLARAIDEAAGATDDDLQVLNEGGRLLLDRDRVSTVAVSILQRAETAHPPAIETDDDAFGPDFTHRRVDFERRRGISFHLLGYACVSLERLAEGAEYCNRAIAADSTLAAAYLNLATAYWMACKSREADSVLSEATRRFPDDPRVGTTIRNLQ